MPAVAEVLSLRRNVRALAKSEHAANIAVPLAARAVSLGLYALAVSVFVAQRGAADYATLGLVMAALSFAPVLDLGVGFAVTMTAVRRLSRATHVRAQNIADALSLTLATCCLIVGLSIVFARPLAQLVLGSAEHALNLVLVTITFALCVLDAVPSALLQSQNRIAENSAARLVTDIGRSTCVILAAQRGWSLTIILILFVGVALAKLTVTAQLTRNVIHGSIFVRPRRRSMKVLARTGIPFGLSALASTQLNLADKIYVAHHFARDTSAHYIVSSDVNVRAYFLIWAVHGAIYTLLFRRAVKGRSPANLVQVSLTAIALTTLLYYLPLALWAPQIVSHWINPDFAAGATPIIRVLAIVAVLYMLADVHVMLARTRRKMYLELASLAVATAMFWSSVSYLAQRFGAPGVAYAVACAFAAMLAVLVLGAIRFRLYTAPAI